VVYGDAYFAHEQRVRQRSLVEFDVRDRGTQACQRVMAMRTGVVRSRSGRHQRVVQPVGLILRQVFDSVEQMRDLAEMLAGFGKRLGIAWSASQHGGMRERRAHRGLRRFGDVDKAQSGRTLDFGLPTDRVGENRRVEADSGAGAFARRLPSGCQRTCGGCD
jgi:hypothetical protein